jgi:hypothetical protein
MRRREFIAGLGAAALPTLRALAQPPAKRAVIGLLLASSKNATQERLYEGFSLRMRRLISG